MNAPQPTSSGVDLARAALAAAKAAARTRPTQQTNKTTRRTTIRRGGRDPLGLGAAITGMMTDHGWETPATGGSILDQWASIAPDLAHAVTAVRLEHNTGTLHLRPHSSAYATQLRLYQAQVLATVQQAPGGASVRALKILPVGATPDRTTSQLEDQPARPQEPGPVRTRETASAGFQTPRHQLLTHRPDRSCKDPDIAAACERQIRAATLPANREPEAAFAEAVAEAERVAGPAAHPTDASRRAAIARKRAEAAGTGQPRRSFDRV